MFIKLKNKKLSYFKSNSGLRAIIANTGWLFIDRILRMGVGLIVGVWIARYLGVQQFGVLNYATAFVAILNPLANLGLNGVVIQKMVHVPSDKEEVLGTTFWLKLLGGFITSLLAITCVAVLRHDEQSTIWIVAILSVGVIFQSFDVIDLWFQSQVQSKYSVLAKNTAFVIITLFRIALIKMQAPLIAFAWVGLAEIGLGAIGLTIAYRFKGFSAWLWGWSFSQAKSLLNESLPFMFASLSILIYMKIDVIMLGEMVGNRAVGIYSAATRISEVWYFIPTSIVSSLSPSIFAAKNISETLYYKKIKQLLRFMILVSILISLPISFFSEIIVIKLFGEAYSTAGLILSIHIWASFFVFTGCAISPWFIAEKMGHLSLYRTIIGAVSNVILNIFLIPMYSGLGAAIATFISYALGAALIDILHPKSQKIFQLQINAMFPFLYSNFFKN
jgi:polysaccharide transporter, PST family